MHPLISIISLILNILLVIRQIRFWKIRCLLSPALYFGAIWSMGLLGVIILHPAGILLEPYPQYIDELSMYVGFTALCFWFLTPVGRTKVNHKPIQVFFPHTAFVILSFLLLLVAIYELYRTGATLDMGASRSVVHETQNSRSTLVNYTLIMSTALSVLAGHEVMSRLAFRGEHLSLILFFPLVANLLISISLGGRVNIIYSFAYYLVGAAFAFGIEDSFVLTVRKYRRQLWAIGIGLILAISFITIVGRQRNVRDLGGKNEADIYLTEVSPVLGAFYGPINYMVSSFHGYQYRRVDAVDPKHLGYGQYTFNGFINWTLPFAGRFGLSDLSIAKTLNIYYDNQETYDFQRELYYSTNSCYIPIFKDFGFWGSFLCIFFLTFVAHHLFIRVQMKNSVNHCYSLFFYLLFWEYWVKSNMYGTLSKSIMILLYGLLLVDILVTLIPKHLH